MRPHRYTDKTTARYVTAACPPGVFISDFEQVQQRVREIHRDLELESLVQGWFYLEEYGLGIEAYGRLQDPTAKDDRWLGACYSMTGDRLMALEVLYRATARGETAAHVELARVLTFLERDQEATQELQKVDEQGLTTADRVLYFRARSIQEEGSGNLQRATELAEEAWRLVQAIPEFHLLAPWVLLRLGRLHFELGRAQRALWCFERALDITEGAVRWSVRLSRADLLTRLGRHAEAISELDSLDTPEAPKNSRVARLYIRAEVARAMSDIRGALNWYGQAIEQAIEDQVSDEEFYSRLALTSLLGFRGALETALEHLSRAKTLMNNKRDQLNYRFREVILLLQQGEYSLEQAAVDLQMLITDFGAMGLLQEQGWVRLHLADLYRQMGDTHYLKELDRLQSLSVTLQNRAFLAQEWAILPHLREAALVSHPKIAGEPSTVLEVYTLGQEKIVLGGQVINIRLRRAVEVLAYFLRHREVNLKKLLADVFSDDNPKTARTYFHQFRHELHERIPQLSIDYDTQSKLYKLVGEMDILWDAAELKAGRRMGELGIFLPSSGSDWAGDFDQELEPLRQGGLLSANRRIETES